MRWWVGADLELQNHIIDLESAARVAVPRDDPDSLQPCHSPPLDMVTTQEEAHMQETYTQEGKVPNDTQPQVMIDSSNDLNSSHPSQLPNIAVQATQDVPTEEGVPHSSPQLQGLTTEQTHEISITEHEIWHASVKAVSDEQMDTQHQGLEVIDPCLECRDQQIGVVEGLETIETSLESRDIRMPTAESGNTSGNLALEISAKAHDKSSDQEMHHTHGADVTGMELHLTKGTSTIYLYHWGNLGFGVGEDIVNELCDWLSGVCTIVGRASANAWRQPSYTLWSSRKNQVDV